MEKKRKELPSKCPLIATCNQLMHRRDFRRVCNCRDWIYCKNAQEKAKKYMQKPEIWFELEKHMPPKWLEGKSEKKADEQKPAEPKKKKSWFKR